MEDVSLFSMVTPTLLVYLGVYIFNNQNLNRLIYPTSVCSQHAQESRTLMC